MNPELYKILVIDDEAPMRHMLRLVLEKQGYQVEEAASGDQGLGLIAQDLFQVVLCDIRMPGMDGLTFLGAVKDLQQVPTIIMMSAYGSIDTAIECMKRGAYDYISKPFKPDEVVLTLKKAEERLGLQQENRRLKEALGEESPPEGIVYSSEEMAEVLRLVRQVADASSPVLIHGETGTGKELVARALHYGSSRRQQPFIAVNCSAIAPSLMESELFGHVRGSFTGADRDREGLFAAADGGTLFLDEIGELPLELQPKLLRVLQEGEFRRVGETRPRAVNVRVLTASARDLQQEVKERRFRDDLYYRLDVVQIEIPPLRERQEDILLLAEHFLRQFCLRERRPVPAIGDDVQEVLMSYDWPGNVRELRNFMEKALIFCTGERLDLASLPWDVRREQHQQGGDMSLKKAAERLEREYIAKALAATGGNRTRSAKLLEISHRSLLYKIKDYDLG